MATESGVPWDFGIARSVDELFAPRGLAADLVSFASRANLAILGSGLAVGGLVHGFGADRAAGGFFRGDDRLSGEVTGTLDKLGSSEVVYAAAIGSYLLGRAMGRPRLRSTGARLTRGLLLTGVIVTATKRLTGRVRPDRRSEHSFPSGHTADFFTVATILHLEYGWKAAVPAYVAAGLMGVSRLDGGRHFLSDVIVGAAVGVVVGRTVATRLERRGIRVGLVAEARGGAGIGFAFHFD